MKSQIRETKFFCKDFLEVYMYPVHEKKRARKRGNRYSESSETQKLLNEKYAERKLIQLLHANFTDEDIALTLTYTDELRPSTPEEAQKEIQNYLRRLKRLYKKQGLELKYISVIEIGTRGGNVHHHLVINGGVDRDALEKAWGKGYANTKRLQFLETGIADLGKYIVKGGAMSKRWTRSKNLIDPHPQKRDGRISQKKVAELASDCENKAEFEKLYPGYAVAEVIPVFNEWEACFQLEIRMFKKDSTYIQWGGKKRRR